MRRGYEDHLDPVETFSGLGLRETTMIEVQQFTALRRQGKEAIKAGEYERGALLMRDACRAMVGLPPERERLAE